jgi:hypothetical protein
LSSKANEYNNANSTNFHREKFIRLKLVVVLLACLDEVALYEFVSSGWLQVRQCDGC